MPLALRSFAVLPAFLGALTELTGSVRAGNLAGAALVAGLGTGCLAAAGLAAGLAPPPPKSGSLNPATDLRSCADNAASLAMEVDVAVEPSAVCDEISRTTCMFFEMFPDATA